MTLPAPAPRAWDPGDIGSETLLNANVRDAFGFLLAPPVFIANQSVSQSIPNNVTPFTPITWDYEILDTYNGHNAQSQTDRYTFQLAGVYLIFGNLEFQTNATGRRLSQLWWNGGLVNQVESVTVTAGGPTGVYNWIVLSVAVGDYVQLTGYQNSGGALGTQAATTTSGSFLEIQLIGGHT